MPEGTGETPIRVPFRDGKAGDLPLEWVELILRDLYANKRSVFGIALRKAVTGEGK